MTNHSKRMAALLCALLTLTVMAQERHERADMIGIGAVQLLDTYLSPEKYRGTEVRVISQSHHPWKNPSWHRQSIVMASFQYAKQRSENSNELGGMLSYGYAIRHRWELTPTWQVSAGGQAETGVGFLYNTRNTNNPAQARAYLHLGPNAMTTWRFPLFHKSFLLRYELSAPLFGVMFSPNYGQSYYEIFSQGNYDHNVVVTTPFCAPTLRNQLSLDVPIGRTTLRIGYLGDYQQAKVNDLKYHTYSHLLIIGLVRPLYRATKHTCASENEHSLTPNNQ